MANHNKKSNWSLIERKLQRETKATLIDLIQELTAVSPTAQRFLQTRTLKAQNIADQIASYRKVIQAQFVFSEWGNTVTWNFAGVQKAIDDYERASQGDEKGLCELLVMALETAVAFADKIGLQDDSFDLEITELVERGFDHLQNQPQLSQKYTRRLKSVQRKGEALGYYALSERLDEI